jgi:hypothetical protein
LVSSDAFGGVGLAGAWQGIGRSQQQSIHALDYETLTIGGDYDSRSKT